MKIKFFIPKNKTFFALLFILFSTALFAQVDKVHIEYERISDRVLLVWGGKIYKDQVVAIATTKGIVMIDAGKAPSLTKEYRKIIEREFGRSDFTYLINTHYHYDHTSGNQIFPEAIIISNTKSPEMMKEWAETRQDWVASRRKNQIPLWVNQLAGIEKESEQGLVLNDYLTTSFVMADDYEHNYQLCLPDLTFNDKMSLDLGDLTLKLYYFGEGRHTGDDILIHCPEEKLLFSGDLFYKGSFGFANRPSFEGERWYLVLGEIFENDEVDWVYDNHIGRMPGEFIALMGNYIKDVWTSLSKAKEAGWSFEDVKDNYSYEHKFSYISQSGLEVAILKRNHESNLKNTWECITQE